METLDLTKLQTVEELEGVNWALHFDKEHNNGTNGWVRHIMSPVLQSELTRVCKLAQDSNKLRLSNSMGELYIKQGSVQLKLFE